MLLNAYILFILITFSQSDTVSISMGSKQIDGSFFQEYTHSWTVSYYAPNTKLIRQASWTDVVRIKQFGETKLFHRVQELYNQSGSLTTLWTNICEIPSMRPVQRSEFSTNGRFNYTEFDHEKVNGTWSGARKELTYETYKDQLNEAPFDWTLYGILLAALPFQDGLIAKLPFYGGINSNKRLDYLIVEMIGKKQIGQFQTWEMKTNQNLVFWVTKEKPYVINLELSAANGMKVVWKSDQLID